MINREFGQYLKELRIKNGKTQDDIAKFIGKSKMLISGVETAKNNAFCENDLEKIIWHLNLSDDEAVKLIRLSSKVRNELPSDVTGYLCDSQKAFDFVTLITKWKFSENQLQQIIKICEEIYKGDNKCIKP